MTEEQTVEAQQSRWGDALAELFAPDPQTGWMDTSEALEAMAWLSRRLYEQTRLDRATWDRAALLTQIERAEAVTDALAAAQTVRIAQFAATTVDDPIGRAAGLTDPSTGGGIISPARRSERLHPLGHKAPFADEEIAAALCLTPTQGTTRTEEAIDAATKTPRLLDRAGAGELDRTRLAQVTRELIEAGPHTCELVEDKLLAAGATSWTSRRIRRRTFSLVQRLDPPAARVARRAKARDAINVYTCPGQVAGTTEWTAILRPPDAARARQAVEELARALHADTTTGKTLGECRADAMTDLILGQAHVDTHLTLLVPVKPAGSSEYEDSSGFPRHTAGSPATARHGWQASQRPFRSARTGVLREPEHPADAVVGDVEVPGVGIIAGSAVRAMVRELGTRITRCLVDADSGTLVSSSDTGYRPGAATRRLVDRRDQHCRFPSCDRAARYCDADHVIPWPRGETTPGNLQLLCRHHHRAKHEAGWSVTMATDGACTWVSPTGRRYVTRPGLSDVVSDLTVTPGLASLRHAPDRHTWEPVDPLLHAAG